jgi:flagellar biosynthesis/type III secretory pathway M-ring protein FliF/YscJ
MSTKEKIKMVLKIIGSLVIIAVVAYLVWLQIAIVRTIKLLGGTTAEIVTFIQKELPEQYKHYNSSKGGTVPTEAQTVSK